MDPKTILVYVPNTWPTISSRVFKSFIEMTGPEVQEELAKKGYRLRIYISNKFPIDLNRNEAFDVSTSTKYQADLIMCCDGDQVFKKNTLTTLLDTLVENPEVGAVTGVYFTKSYPHRAVVGKYSPWNDNLLAKRASLLSEGFIAPDGSQLLYFKHLQYFDVIQPVDVFGLGCILMRTSIFAKMQQPLCRYVNGYSTGGDFTFQGHSEDMWLCRNMKLAGIKVLVNPKVVVGHVTEKVIVGNEAED